MSKERKDSMKLVKKLCTMITGLPEDSVSSQFQCVLRILGSNVTSPAEFDELHVAEKIKKKLVREHREKDAALFSGLHRKLQTLDVIKNRWAILHLMMNLNNSQSKSTSKAMVHSVLFGKHLLHGPTTSTPLDSRQPRQPEAETPALGLSSVHGHSGSGMTTATGSSGISSVRSRDITGPSPAPQSFAPSYMPTPGPTTRPPLGGSRQAWTASNQTYNSIKTESNTRKTSHAQTIAQPSKSYPHASSELPESALVREIVYILQGIEGQFIKFESRKDGFKIDQHVGLPKTVRNNVHKLIECGWLFNKIRNYTDSKSIEKAFGLVGQSFCAALQQELTEYYRLLAVLEAQLQQESDQGISVGAGLTLQSLSVWLTEPQIRLKAMAALVDICKGKKGGDLSSAIHSYIKHGDPFLQGLVKHTLTLVAQPIFSIITRWIYDGELEDTYHEFFVASDPTVKEDQLWHQKYSLRKPMIPSFISMDQANKILLTGKSINFLRQLCHDRTRIRGNEVIKASESMEADAMFTQDQDGGFQKMIDIVYSGTSQHLLEVLHSKYMFMDHLKAMRRYLLLGQGDFIRHLMDLLEEDLAKPAGTLYLHNLTGIVETAVRATNAQFDDPDILKRLDVRILEISPGDTGWDVFSLDYHVDGPIKTVFTPESMIMYLRVFNFLWRAKRMEYILTGIWKGQISNARLLRDLPETSQILQQCHILGCEMIHFVQQIQYYINFEVLECSWDELVTKVQRAKDLDHIIAAHQEFVDAVLTRSLLDEQSKAILTQLRTIFDLIIQFQTSQDQFYEVALEERDQRHRFTKQMEFKTKQGEWGVTEDEEKEEKQRIKKFISTTLPQIRANLKVLAQSYQDMVKLFLVMLHDHSDVSLQFLSFRLDFNEYYKDREPKLRSPFSVKQRKQKV